MTATNTRTVTGPLGGEGAVPRAQEHLLLVIDRARPLEGGARHSLANIDCVTIGRERARRVERVVVDRLRTLILNVSDERVSLLHARLERCKEGFRIVDCASRNGIRVNGRPIAAAGPTPLADGDLVELGHTFFGTARRSRRPPGHRVTSMRRVSPAWQGNWPRSIHASRATRRRSPALPLPMSA